MCTDWQDPALDPLCLHSLASQRGSEVGANLGSQEQSRSQEQPTYRDAAGPHRSEPAFTELPLKREFRTAHKGAPDGNPDWL